jgi:hypothetical protein
MTQVETDGEVFATILVGAEEGDVQTVLVKAASAGEAISAVLHDSRWESYACPAAFTVGEVQSILDSMRDGIVELCAKA